MNGPIQIRIHGDKQLSNKLGQFQSGFQQMALEAGGKAVTFVHSQIPDYPAPPPLSTYIRTLTLFRTITSFAGAVADAISRVEPVFGGIRAFVGTILSYAHWVIDEDDQAFMHRGRWWTLQGVVRESRQGIVDVFGQAVREYVNSIFQ